MIAMVNNMELDGCGLDPVACEFRKPGCEDTLRSTKSSTRGTNPTQCEILAISSRIKIFDRTLCAV